MLTNAMAETISLFSAIKMARETPSVARLSPAFRVAVTQLTRSDNPAIRAKAARLVPETTCTNGSAA